MVKRLDAVLKKISQKLRWPKPAAGSPGMTFNGPTRRKFVSPYEALRNDVANEAIPKGLTANSLNIS